MPTPRTALLTLLLGTQLTTSGLRSQHPHTDPRHGPAAEQEAKDRLARIRAEIDSLGAEPGWAGAYYYGDGMGVNVTLHLAPKAGFVFSWSGCLGTYDRNYGSWTDKDGRLELTFTFPNVRQGFQGLAPVLIPVRWGERHYLIASTALADFANEVNSGSEPRDCAHGSALLRVNDERKPVQGLPELPRECADLLLTEPVEGMIVAIRDSHVETVAPLEYRVTEAVIDRGKRHGLRQGHVVHFIGKGRFVAGSGTILELAEQTAHIRIRAMVVPNGPVPEVGWKWSTRWKSSE